MEKMNLATLAQLIAQNLEGWTWEQHDKAPMQDSWQMLAGPDGAKIDLHFEKNHSRISIGGLYPHDGNGIYPWNASDRPADITVSANREPSNIAREIKRRFLPAYLAAYRKGLELFTKTSAREQTKKELALKLAQLCGEDQHLRGLEFSHYGSESFSFVVRVDGHNLVQLTIHSLPAQKAECVLRLLIGK